MSHLSRPRASISGPSGSQTSKDLFSSALQSRTVTNSYIAHLKIWEAVTEGAAPGTAGAQRKARYLILAVQKDTGRVTLNKAKRNANGSYSIGKDWDLNTLREIIVHDATTFTLTLSRSYSWETENAKEQSSFLQAAVKIYRKYTGDLGPHCVGLEDASSSDSIDPAPAPSTTIPRQASVSHSRADDRIPSINTSVSSAPSKQSPLSAGTRRGQDGFYNAADRSEGSVSSPMRPTLSTLPPTISEDARTEKRPSLRRNANSGPMSSSQDIRQSEASRPSPPIHRPSTAESDAKGLAPPATFTRPAKSARSPGRPNGLKTSVVADETNSQSTQEPETKGQSLLPAPSSTIPTRPLIRPRRSRTSSMESIGSASTGGDARARLSSIEPVRGGAAYEKMLLAGTGLTGVAEGDEEEEMADVYGGADLGSDGETIVHEEILPRSTRPGDKRSPQKKHKLNREDLRDAGEVGSVVKAELVDEDEEDMTLANVEEMLEGFEWKRQQSNGMSTLASNGSLVYGGKRVGKGPADVIEARLLDELAALDAANIHAIIESDDRVSWVVRHMEEALHQLDLIDSMVASYKMQLNARAEEISHIEGQNRGLQVQTSNQRALSNEIDRLLNTVQVDEAAVEMLLHSEFESDDGISEVERAGAALYKAMLQARRSDVDDRGGSEVGGIAAATERLDEYAGLANTFAKRLFEYLSHAFVMQTKSVLKDPNRSKALAPPYPTIESQQQVEDFLGRYCGLLLYAKEVSPDYFQRISASYFTSASERYKGEMVTLISVWRGQITAASDEEIAEASFYLPGQATIGSVATRAGTVRRGVARSKGVQGQEVAAHEAFSRILVTITPLIAREQGFVADLLHINHNNITFADYMNMEVYFRRRAADVFGSTPASGSLRDMKSALDLIFSFLSPELQSFVDQVFSGDRIQLVGVLAALDRSLSLAQEINNEFLIRNLGKLQMKSASQLDKFMQEQVRAIEQTKLTVKKRKGVTNFIKVFPSFVERIEVQLVEAEMLPIRPTVDAYYEQICKAMFDALQAMAIPKMESSTGNYLSSNIDEDKGMMNHHIILIENMYHFVKHVGRLHGSAALAPLLQRAQGLLDDALSSYVQSALRRPLGKMMDFGDGIDTLLRSTPANEVSLHSAYNRQAAKRLVKEYSSKDIRKSIEALGKRVAKHFDDDEVTSIAEGLSNAANVHDASGIGLEEIVEVLGMVWRNLEDGFTTECQRLQRVLKDCYSQSNESSKLLCDFTMEDVRKPFASNAPAGKRR